MILISALMLVQAPVGSQPKAADAAQKPKQVCEMIEVTGSRSKKRVCRNASGELDLGPGVSSSGFGKAKFDQRGQGTGNQGLAQ